MTADLLQAIEKLHISSRSRNAKDDEPLDTFLTTPRRRRCIKQAPEAIKKELQDEFLMPSTTFSTEWLNKFQE